jgi:hypothetical protein
MIAFFNLRARKDKIEEGNRVLIWIFQSQLAQQLEALHKTVLAIASYSLSFIVRQIEACNNGRCLFPCLLRDGRKILLQKKCNIQLLHEFVWRSFRVIFLSFSPSVILLHAFNIWWTYRCKAYLLLIDFLYSDTNFLIKKKFHMGYLIII